MKLPNSINQAANKFVANVENLFSLRNDQEKKMNSKIPLLSDQYMWGNCPNCWVSLRNDKIKTVTTAECPCCHRLFCPECKDPWYGRHKCQPFQERENMLDIDDEKKSGILYSGDNDEMWLNCPFNDCSAWLLKEEIKIVTNANCPCCHRRFCTHCKILWRSGHNCQRFQQRQKRLSTMRKSFFQDCANEKKKQKVTFAINQNSKGILIKSSYNAKKKRKKAIETSYECTLPSPKCGICFDLIQDSDIVRGSTKCNHTFCSDCISKHVGDQLKENIIKVFCPNLGCFREVKLQHLQHILPKEVISRWEHMILTVFGGFK
ncbi:uncharacterized protein LOC123896335 [Trifolium pratense]|uniref:uncharacterized protein LOC123896335 n=1 Tax=Trifolium pratense TaxID=57577 RepID=UPI001E692E3D|nr:uncharacterized protein LOC123896335 [Trifolium pratense]